MPIKTHPVLTAMKKTEAKSRKVFNPAIFDFQRLTLAPLLLFIGFVIEIFAIMIRPKVK